MTEEIKTEISTDCSYYKDVVKNEIIIDGVNVAGCSEFLKPDGCDDTDCASFQCDRNTNCYYKQLKRLEQENRGLKEEIQFHNKENSNLLAERNAAQIGYDEIREVRERYRSVLVEIREILNKECGIISNAKVVGIINEVLSV